MKVVHVLNHFLPNQTAGTEVYVWALSKQLQKIGIDVTVVIPNYESEFAETYQFDGIDVYKYSEKSKADRKLILGLKKSNGVDNFQKYIADTKPDIVHFHELAGSNGVSVFHIEAAKELGVQVLFTMHLASATCNSGNLMFMQKNICDGIINVSKCTLCSLQKRLNSDMLAHGISLCTTLMYRSFKLNTMHLNNSFGTLLSYPFQIENILKKLKRIEAACDIIIPITKWYKEILLQNGVSEKKLQLVLQGLPTSPTKITAIDLPNQLPLKLIFIGRISELKGISILIEAAKRFSPDQLQLDIYGATNDTNYYNTCINATMQIKVIRWMGKLRQEEVINVMQQYHALILPSIFSEMSPLVIQEAFTAKIPVIGSNVYGISEQVINSVNGFLFEMGNVDSLVNLLSKLVDDKSLLLNCKFGIPTTRNFNLVASEYLGIYNKLLNT